jgi:hypothetical protein
VIALNGAFLAAASDEPLQMHHLVEAAASEFAKLQKPFSVAEMDGPP